MCDGAPPLLYTGGSVVFGRKLFLRNRTARTELGAVDGGSLSVGDGTFINQGCTIVARERIQIGSGVLIGDSVAVYDTTHHALEPARPARTEPVVIEDHVWLARGVIVMPGVTIGRHSVVAAGSVVTRSVGEATLVGGVPAQVIRALEIPDGWRRR